ncbi:MAG: helix-turn-helix transcriptional regulator [Chloroflexi bacterium]|jgi:DNA-binding transcriptional ArsR family regulator|nr:MAG: helix-turn-helix transcriptional regulator [Chloroflexota bacterium]
MREDICMSMSSSSFSPKQSTQITAEEPTRNSPDIDKFVDHFLALMCDRSRRQILQLLAIPNDNPGLPLERRSTDIARELGLSPATTSGHLRQLSEARLIASRREGNVIYYRLYNHLLVRAFQDLIAALDHEHSARQIS